MWINKETNKPVSLKKLIQQGFNTALYKPETLADSCPVTHGLNEKRLDWVMALEDLGNEEDRFELERKLKLLLKEMP